MEASALPDVYRKVLAAKEDLLSGRITSVSEAARRNDISRGAYYKYKDFVFPYVGKAAHTMTVELLLQDCPGVLSSLLSVFARAGANIITVNQQSPAGGKASVSICAQTDTMSLPMDRFVEELGKVPGVQSLTGIQRQEIASPNGTPQTTLERQDI